MERNSARRYCREIDIINYRISTQATPLHVRNGRTMRIVIRKGMRRYYFHTEESTTTTSRTRIKHARTICRLSESVRFSQPRTTMENIKQIRSAGRNDHRFEEATYQREISPTSRKGKGRNRSYSRSDTRQQSWTNPIHIPHTSGSPTLDKEMRRVNIKQTDFRSYKKRKDGMFQYNPSLSKATNVKNEGTKFEFD